MKTILILILVVLMITPAFSAKYAGESFALGVGGRALGMGGATIAGPFDATAGYWNPAGLNYLSGQNITAMHAETFGSLLNHDFIGYTSNRKKVNSTIKAYGFYFYYLGGGGINITEWDAARNRPVIVRELTHGDYLLAGSVSGKIKNKIDFGVTARIIYRDLGASKGFGFTVDAGALYQLSNKFRLGLMVTDLTSGYIRFTQKYSESILPTVKPGVLFKHNIKDFTLRLALSGDIRFEGIKDASQFWVGDISFDSHFGGELSYKELIFGRLGSDIGKFTAGVGLNINRIKIDLAYLHNSDLDATFRISAGYRFK
ncbi:MAG: PorV/PorQ family protein [candidate division Zixibacteria bacterium]|nr:PorV/PorQ family protein [candidate division Zixibacteria bacterium]